MTKQLKSFKKWVSLAEKSDKRQLLKTKEEAMLDRLST